MKLPTILCLYLGLLGSVLAAEPVTLDPVNGAIVRAGAFHSGEDGLWRIKFRDGSILRAAECQCESERTGETLSFRFRAPDATVLVTVNGSDLVGQVTPTRKTVLEFALPATLRFDPATVRRFISPLHPHLGVGAAFNRAFFEPQPTDRPSGWQPKKIGPDGCRRLLGARLEMRDLDAPPIPVQVTTAGREWLRADRFANLKAKVNRTVPRRLADLVLLDSTNGPFFAASRLGGTGALWRFGGECDERAAAEAVVSVLRKLGGTRRRVALVSLTNGPEHGGLANGSVSFWRKQLAAFPLTELRRAEEMVAAARSDEFLAILNPYGEWLPVPVGSTPEATLDDIGSYIRHGGNWFEVGGYSFFAALQPEKFLRYEHKYPPVFSDFMHLDSTVGAASLYRVRPRDDTGIFVPGWLAFGGDERGGWCERVFGTFVEPGKTWTAPPVRLALGRSAEESLRDYLNANGITRTLREKLPSGLFAKLRRAVLVKYDGNAREKLAALAELPVPTLIHWSDYLKGGFDKEYPDHLPPHPSFGTAEELGEFLRRARELGHLTMPYTNPTWWCDHPRGPTFLAAGEAPLLRTLEGRLNHERYGANDGWTTTFWHPAVRAANATTVRLFCEVYPVDLLLQDQNGARQWHYDLNPASPTPYAYTAGLIAAAEEAARAKPLFTEDGWDGVVNAHVQFCGFTFALVPGRRPEWVREMKTVYHPSTWELYPFAQRVAHDKVLFCHHDLGKFVTDERELSWTLGLGFNMSYRVAARALSEPKHREWLRWLDRIQKSVCARYAGEPVVSFKHQQGGETPDDDGLIRARYGPVTVTARLGGDYGFRATAPGMVAGPQFVAEGDARRAEVWVYAEGGGECAVELPEEMTGTVSARFDGESSVWLKADGGVVRLRLPAGPKKLWHAVVIAGR